jgi:hypothetical protein
LPASDADVVEDKAQQLLAAFEVECVEARERALCEAGDALAEAVVVEQLSVLVGKVSAFVFEVASAGVEFSGATCHFRAVDHSGLVEVG